MTSNFRQFLGIVALACLCSWTRTTAEEAKQKALAIESVLPIALDSADPAQSLQTTNIRLRLSSGEAPITMEVVEARLEKRSTNFASAFKFGLAQGTAPELTVPLEISLARLPFVGKYVVKVRAVRAAESKAEVSAEVEMTFERPSAQLVPVEEFLLQRDPITGHIDPDKLYITEQSGVAFVRFAFPLVSGQLRGPGGELLPADLQFHASEVLRSGQRLALTPVANGSLPLGTSTATVQLESPQLAAPLDVKFKLVNRVAFGWLPVTIIAFIGLGIWYRWMLADRQALDQALLEAQQAYARLKDIVDIQAEPQLQSRIGAAIASLATAIRRAESVEGLRAAASQAGASVDTILAEAAESRRNSRAAIAGLESALGRPHGHRSDIAQVIEDANCQLEEFLRDLDRGLAQSLERRITSLASDLKDKLSALVESLATEIKEDLEQIGPWPGTEIATEASNLVRVISEAEQAPADNLAETVQTSQKVTRAARLFFTQTLRVQVTNVVGGVLNALTTASNESELAAVKTLQAQISAEGPLVDREPPYHKLVALVRDLRDALAKLVRAKAPANTQPVEDALEAGEFIAAAKAAKAAAPAKPKVESFGPTRATEAQSSDRLIPDIITFPADQLPPTPTLRIIAPAEVHVGQTVEVRALIEPPVENPAVSWTVMAGLVGQEQRDGMRFVFFPYASGTVIIACEVSHTQLAQPLSAQTSVRVAQSAAELAVVAIRERIGQRELIMSGITGIFVAAAGTMIFSDTFVGSSRDFLFAALWGFTADLGAGRLRALAEPLMSRQIPGLTAQRGAAAATGGGGN